MKTIKTYRAVKHGIEGQQYFRGHGVAFTKYTDCATGIGDSEAEALSDAFDSLHQIEHIDKNRLEEIEGALMASKEGKRLVFSNSVQALGEEEHIYVSVDLELEGTQ